MFMVSWEGGVRYDSKLYCSWLAAYARVEVRVFQCRLKTSSDRDGKGFRNWSQMQMIKLHDGRVSLLSKSSSFCSEPGAGDRMLGLFVGDGMRALFEKRTSSFVTRFWLVCLGCFLKNIESYRRGFSKRRGSYRKRL